MDTYGCGTFLSFDVMGGTEDIRLLDTIRTKKPMKPLFRCSHGALGCSTWNSTW